VGLLIWFCYLEISKIQDTLKVSLKTLGSKYPRFGKKYIALESEDLPQHIVPFSKSPSPIAHYM
jgi:hypothetical protein